MKDKQVEDFIRRLQPSAPVDIVAIANVLGLKVYESQELPQGIAGKIFIDKKHGGESGYTILVRGADNFARKRFTIAHEVAHYLLHKHLFRGGELVDDALYRSNLSTHVEIQANGLAADLLMPWHLLAPRAHEGVSELARLFQVSEQAMRIRLDSANLSMAAGSSEPIRAAG
jgi:Zn-dependent peptidase ImmA (M78 family)